MEHAHHPKIIETDHDHHHDGHAYLHRPNARKRLIWGMILTGSVMVVEALGGWMTGSLALLSDAGHMLSHFFALGTSFIAILVASQAVSKRYSFGLYRVEILSALFNGASLLVIVGIIFYEGYQRFLDLKPIATVPMFWVALLGLLVNLLTAWILHGVEKSDINVRGAFLHMLADTASSVGVILGAILIYFTGWLWMDPVLSCFIGLIIAVWSFGLLKDSIRVLLEATPKNLDPEAVTQSIKNAFPEISVLHDMHIWEITSNMYSMTAHLGTRSEINLQDFETLVKKISEFVDKKFHISHTNFQFESART